MNSRSLRVCYFGTYRANYSRNRIMIEGLRRNGVEVIECHARLWQGVEDRVHTASGGWLRPTFVVRVLRTYWKLLQAWREVPDYDVMVLGYPGQLDLFLARLLTWLQRKPLVLDVFMSLYLIALERGLTVRHPVSARLIYWLERLACLLPELLILDTPEYVQWFQDIYCVDPARFRLVPTGADDGVFGPLETGERDDGLFRVLYYGTFIPNHGVETIVRAAGILGQETDIRFELVGDGPTRAQAEALVKQSGLTNVTFVGWLDQQELLHRVAEADICLGVFGVTPQSMMTIQNKIYEGLAMAKPVISGDSPTIRQALTHGEHLYLCERANPQALAGAVLALKVDPGLCRRLGDDGHRFFQMHFGLGPNGARYAAHLEKLVEGHYA